MTYVFQQPDYARTRDYDPTTNSHNWNEGSQDALNLMTGWLTKAEPFCHVRYADGEFWSILGRVGPNADGQEHLPGTLGKDLQLTLRQIADYYVNWQRASGPEFNVLVGGCWGWPTGAKQWLIDNHLLESIPWCPIQCFVDGILGGHTMRFLQELRNMTIRNVRQLYLVANDDVGRLAPSMGAKHVSIHLPRRKREECVSPVEIKTPNTPGWYGMESAYADMPRVHAYLRQTLDPGDVVIWCAGLGCKPTLWCLFRECEGTTHIDCGCLFDGAAGLTSRTWLTNPPDERLTEYREKYIPWLRGEQK